MKYLSVCSGIEAASVAWEPLGWEPVAFSEIDPFPSAVLTHHFPHVPNLGDMTKHATWNIKPGSIDILVGGTPCQSFSVAGLRQGLDDPRGGLMLRFVEIAQRLRPRWVVWENVPGVLSSNGGRDFGTLLGALGELGYGWAYRVLDAQYVRTHRHPRAVPQRRRRVFVVGCAGDWRRAAEVLFERESVRRDTSARRKTREGAAADVAGSLGVASSGNRGHLDGHGAYIPEVVGTLNDGAHMGGGLNGQDAYTGRIIAYRKSKRAQSVTDEESLVEAADRGQADGSAYSLNAMHGHDVHAVYAASATVRRLTPRECESLQGFPRGYTAIPWRGRSAEDCPDGPRYRALGNSMAVNCMEWIGQRIADVEARISA